MRASVYFVITSLLLIGCSKNTPTFGVLDQNAIPQPTFGGETQLSVSPAGLAVTSPIQGECDPRIRAIAVSVIGGTVDGPLDAAATATPVVDCAGTGKFSFTLKGLDGLLNSPQANQTYRIELRGQTAGGRSNASVILVTFVKDLPERTRLTSGGSESGAVPRGVASASFRADVRLTHFVNATDATAGADVTRAASAHYQIRYGRAAQAADQ